VPERGDPCHKAAGGATFAGRPPPQMAMARSAKQQQKESRTRRLSAALRDNLKRRKAQARQRAGTAEQPTGTHDSAGIEADKPRS
jgi:hypothetical protein